MGIVGCNNIDNNTFIFTTQIIIMKNFTAKKEIAESINIFRPVIDGKNKKEQQMEILSKIDIDNYISLVEDDINLEIQYIHMFGPPLDKTYLLRQRKILEILKSCKNENRTHNNNNETDFE